MTLRPKPRMKRLSIITAAIALTSIAIIAGSCIERKPEHLTKKESPVSGELSAMVAESESLQSDGKVSSEVRQGIIMRHHQTVYDLLSQSLLIEPIDLYRAALLLQDTVSQPCAETWLLAHYMAAEAARKGYEGARYLAAASYDRYLLARGHPQKYGTQQERDRFGRWYIPFYDTLTTDSERAAWDVPPLEKLKASASSRNK
jgi:hypothetical protein